MLPPITVVIADDHVPLRTLLRIILEADGFVVLAEAASADEAVEKVAAHEPRICLLDLQMPGGGMEAVAQIAARAPSPACVILSASEDDEDLIAAVRAGAEGFLSKSMELERLPDALRGVLRGEAALPRRRVARVLEELRQRDPAPPAEEGRRVVDLTEEEWSVIQDLRVRSHGEGRARRWSRPGR